MQHNFSHYLPRLIILMTLLTISIVVCAGSNDIKEIDKTIKAGENAFNAKDPAKAIRLFMKARKMSANAKRPKEQCLSTYNIGVCYFMISENGEALKNYYDAYTICKDNDLGWALKSKILNGIAGVYFEERNYQKAGEIANQCYLEAVSKRDTALAYTYAIDMALICNEL